MTAINPIYVIYNWFTTRDFVINNNVFFNCVTLVNICLLNVHADRQNVIQHEQMLEKFYDIDCNH